MDKKIGILCAGDDELAPFLPMIENRTETRKAMLTIYEGEISGVPVAALFSGVCNYFTIVLPLGGLDQPGAVLSTTMGMFFTQLLFFALGLLFASLFKSYKAAVRAGTVFVLAAYVLAFTAEYTGNRFLDYLTPLRYYDVYEVALNGVYLSYIVLTVLIVGACVMVSTRRWKLREL